MMTVFRLVLLVGLVLCAIATALVKKPMQAVAQGDADGLHHRKTFLQCFYCERENHHKQWIY